MILAYATKVSIIKPCFDFSRFQNHATSLKRNTPSLNVSFMCVRRTAKKANISKTIFTVFNRVMVIVKVGDKWSAVRNRESRVGRSTVRC